MAFSSFVHVLQIDQLQRQLQRKCQNTQNIQDELDDVTTKCVAEEAITLEKLKKATSDVQQLQDANRDLSQTIRDMEIERKAMENAQEELDRRCRKLEGELQRAEQGYREVVALKERLEEENRSVIQQLNGAHEREKKSLQLIQDLEQEIHHNIRGRPGVDLASVRLSETPMEDLADRVAMDCMSDQADSQPGSTESTPAVLRPDVGTQSSVGSPAGSDMPCQNSDLEEKASTPAPSSVRLQKMSKICASATDTLETDFAAQRVTAQSGAGRDEKSMECVSSPKLSCANDGTRPDDSHASHTGIGNSLIVQNRIDDDPVPTYPTSSHSKDATEREVNDVMTNRTNDRSTQPSLSSSPPPDHWNNESTPLIVPHHSRVITSSESTEQPTMNNEDGRQNVPSRHHDQLGSDQASETLPRIHNLGEMAGEN